MTLFEISQDMQALDDLLEGAVFDDPEVQQQLAKWNAELAENLSDKVDNYAAFIQTLLARSEARQKEGNRLAERARIDNNNAKRLQDFLKMTLEFRKLKKVETDRYTVSVAGNGGKQPIECLVKAEDLPPELQTIVPEQKKINTDEIRTRLTAGEEIGGCRLLPRGTHLRIK